MQDFSVWKYPTFILRKWQDMILGASQAKLLTSLSSKQCHLNTPLFRRCSYGCATSICNNLAECCPVGQIHTTCLSEYIPCYSSFPYVVFSMASSHYAAFHSVFLNGGPSKFSPVNINTHGSVPCKHNHTGLVGHACGNYFPVQK